MPGRRQIRCDTDFTGRLLRDGLDTSDLGPEHLVWLGQHLDDCKSGTLPRIELSDGRVWTPTERDRFIQHWLRIRTKSGDRSFFKLNRAQREYSWRCTKQNLVLKARQVGITTYIAARFFTQTIARPGTLSLQVTQDRESAEDIFRIVRRFWENLPEEARKEYLRTSYRSKRHLVFPSMDSEYCLAAAAENAGRGRTIQNLHCSEVSRWGRKGVEALASLRSAVVPGGEIVLESTPNGASGLFYEEWQGAAETGFTRHFFPWWFEQSYVAETGPSFLPLTEEESVLAEAHGLTIEQLAWRRHKWATLRGLARQEFAEDPVECFRASGECVFELEAIEQGLREASEPVETRDNGRLTTWLPAQPGRKYLIGVDPAGGGVDGDYSCAQVIDRELGAQCAELHGHYPLRELARELVKLGESYNTALMAVERNNHGYGVLANLRNMGYLNVFQQDNQDGWLTSAVSRPAMIENLSAALAEKPGLFRSPRLLNECRTFVRGANGIPSGAPGTHDDCVMAMAIAWAVRAAEVGEVRSDPRSRASLA